MITQLNNHKKHIVLITILLLVNCKSEINETSKNKPKKEVVTQSHSNTNYSNLFDACTCDISITELAKTLHIPASDITLSENPSAEHCAFLSKGFGQGYDDTDTGLNFGPSFNTKKNNKKVITNHLKEKKEMPNGIAGSDILLADADDCYLTF